MHAIDTFGMVDHCKTLEGANPSEGPNRKIATNVSNNPVDDGLPSPTPAFTIYNNERWSQREGRVRVAIIRISRETLEGR